MARSLAIGIRGLSKGFVAQYFSGLLLMQPFGSKLAACLSVLSVSTENQVVDLVTI